MMNRKINYVQNFSDSHDVVAYTMILTNYLSAVELKKYKQGIFRGVEIGEVNTISVDLPSDVLKVLRVYQTNGGIYTLLGEGNDKHELLALDSYIHITSPIRRLVDILNQIKLLSLKGLITTSENSEKFYTTWISPESLEYINNSMKAIRKLQNDCSILSLCVSNESVLSKIYKGYLFNRIKRVDKLFQYTLYLPELHVMNRYISRYELSNYTCCNIKLFIFINTANFKKKIRMEIVV